MREKLAALLFDYHEHDDVEATPASIVQLAPRCDAARADDWTKQTEDGLPVRSFHTLLADLGTLANPGRNFTSLQVPQRCSSEPSTSWAFHCSQNCIAHCRASGNAVNMLLHDEAVSVG